MSVRQSSGPKTLADLRAIRERQEAVKSEVEKSRQAILSQKEDTFANLAPAVKAELLSVQLDPAPGSVPAETGGEGIVSLPGIIVIVALVGIIFLAKRL